MPADVRCFISGLIEKETMLYQSLEESIAREESAVNEGNMETLLLVLQEKQKIIAECDAREKTECAAAAKAAADGNAAALAALEQQRRQAAETMTAAAKAKQAQWCAELVQRTLGGEAAQ